MSFFAKSTPAPPQKIKNIQTASLGLAAIFLILVVAQLFTFERFPDILAQMNVSWGNKQIAMLQAALLVTLEVGSLPFLLFMPLSRAARVASMVAGWSVAIWWLYVSLWVNLTQPGLVNGGLLGATIELPAGWWMTLLSLVLVGLAAWVGWGMWPLDPKAKK